MKYFFSISFLFLFSFLSYGQTGQDIQLRKINEINRFAERLDLSDSQVEKLKKIVNRKYDDFAIVYADRTSNLEKYSQKVKAIFEGNLVSVKMILKTDKQLEAFTAYKIQLRRDKASFLTKNRNPNLSRIEQEMHFYESLLLY